MALLEMLVHLKMVIWFLNFQWMGYDSKVHCWVITSNCQGCLHNKVNHVHCKNLTWSLKHKDGKIWNCQKMPWPGFEPGLLRPQRRVLTTRRSRLARDMECCAWNVDGIFDFMSGRLHSNLKLTFVSRFSWCSGYHICLTHRRSPVRSRAKTAVPRGLTARISGFHPGGPGSTPGVGIHFVSHRTRWPSG